MSRFPGLPNIDLVRDLTLEERWVLSQWGVNAERPSSDRDLRSLRIVRDPGHRKRLEEKGLSKGHWHGGRRFYYPVEIAQFLLSLRDEPPPGIAERVSRSAQVRAARLSVTAEDSPESPTPTSSPASSSKPRRQRRAEPATA
jgi:hypothetical protein